MAKNKQDGGGATALGLAALAAAAAGAYYFYGSKDAKKHQRKMKSWAVKARGEVMEKMEHMKSLSQATYDKAVTEVMDKYKKIKTISPAEVNALAKDMKSHWNRISAHLNAPTAKPKRRSSTSRPKK